MYIIICFTVDQLFTVIACMLRTSWIRVGYVQFKHKICMSILIQYVWQTAHCPHYFGSTWNLAEYPFWMLIIARELCSRRLRKLNWGLKLMLPLFFLERCYTHPCHCRNRTSLWSHKVSLGRYFVLVGSSSDAELLVAFHDDVCYDAESSNTRALSPHQLQNEQKCKIHYNYWDKVSLGVLFILVIKWSTRIIQIAPKHLIKTWK